MALTYIIGYDHVGAHGDTQKQIHHYADYRPVAANGRHGPRSVIAAYHRHIHSVERLLQYAARYQRQREHENFAPQRPVEHIYLIGVFSHSFSAANLRIPAEYTAYLFFGDIYQKYYGKNSIISRIISNFALINNLTSHFYYE